MAKAKVPLPIPPQGGNPALEEAAQSIIGLINCRPTTPRQDEIEAVLSQHIGHGPRALTLSHAQLYSEWRALIDEHMEEFGQVDKPGMSRDEIAAEEDRMAEHTEKIYTLAKRILGEPARTWADAMLLVEVTFWRYWPGIDYQSDRALTELRAGPQVNPCRDDETLATLLEAIRKLVLGHGRSLAVLAEPQQDLGGQRHG